MLKTLPMLLNYNNSEKMIGPKFLDSAGKDLFQAFHTEPLKFGFFSPIIIKLDLRSAFFFLVSCVVFDSFKSLHANLKHLGVTKT